MIGSPPVMQEVRESSNHASSDDRAEDSGGDSERPANRVADKSGKGSISAESKVERSCGDKKHAQREREQPVTNSRNDAEDDEVPQSTPLTVLCSVSWQHLAQVRRGEDPPPPHGTPSTS